MNQLDRKGKCGDWEMKWGKVVVEENRRISQV